MGLVLRFYPLCLQWRNTKKVSGFAPSSPSNQKASISENKAEKRPTLRTNPSHRTIITFKTWNTRHLCPLWELPCPISCIYAAPGGDELTNVAQDPWCHMLSLAHNESKVRLYISKYKLNHMSQNINSQRALHSWTSQVSYGVSFMSILETRLHVTKRLACISIQWHLYNDRGSLSKNT